MSPDVIDLCSPDDEEMIKPTLINERVMCSHPSCNTWVEIDELDNHELCHRLAEEEDLERVESGTRSAAAMQEEEDFIQLQQRYGFAEAPKNGFRCFTCGQEGHWSGDSACPSKPPLQPLPTTARDLTSRQKLDDQHKKALECQPLIPLIARTLSDQKGKGKGYEVYLVGPGVCLMAGVSRDRGWSCGYRNIQMQCSWLLSKEGGSDDIKKALFGGCGFVPDVLSLQAWLEAAWREGFDPPGCDSLGGSVQGSTKWIGTTEGCSLFRSFGLSAEIVDFKSKTSSLPGARFHRRGDGRAVHVGVQCDSCDLVPIIGPRHHSKSKANYDLCDTCVKKDTAAVLGPFETIGQDHNDDQLASSSNGGLGGGGGQVKGEDGGLVSKLMDWVWKYFSSGNGSSAASGLKVKVTTLPPLYFQHEGHSRTIIGIERVHVGGEKKLSASEAAENLFGGPAAWKKGADQADFEYTLLILDPALGYQGVLQDALVTGRGWQRFIRRGASTLSRHNELQILYIDSGGIGVSEKQIRCKELIEA